MNDGSASWRLGDVVEVMGDGIEISGGGYHLFASSITARRVEVRKRNGARWEKEEGRGWRTTAHETGNARRLNETFYGGSFGSRSVSLI